MKFIYNGHSKSSGIYQIKNLINGKVYIGQAKQLATRAMQHEQALINQKHGNRHLQSAWNLYGSEAFEFSVLQVVEDKAERDVAEQALITQFFGEGCYNINPSVSTTHRSASVGKGRVFSEEHKAKLSAANKGKNKGKGKKQSPEHIEKRRLAMIGKNKGQKRSEEVKKKMYEAQFGKKKETK